ncbi:MAG: LysR substrate-binding domain-containing protein [Gammaproteobacteria bacterium]|nr:LysR substrate-binding domain-containing protein [Gammaproteobacteria bacterium]
MNIKDLKYLVALSDLGHFGHAANACFVSQPALSMQIKKLEAALGVTLLERTSKSLLMTEVGSLIAERARDILNQVDEIHEVAKLAKDPYSGELKLGIFPTLAPYLLPLIIPQLTKDYPNLSIYLIEEKSASLIDKLNEGKIHAAILALPLSQKNLKSTLLFEEEFLLATPSTHPLAKRKYITPKDLDNKNLLLLEEGHCMRNQALAICNSMQAKEAQHFRATSLETLRHMVSAGVGITLIPKLACTNSDTISYVPFNQFKPARTIGLFWRATSAKQLLLEDLALKMKAILLKQKTVKIIN